MLTLIGLGLYDEKDITLKGIDAVQKADRVYIETYTSTLTGTNLETMQEIYKREILPLTREDIELHAEEKILDEAKERDIAILIGGDPLIATTHVDLRIRARDMGIPVKIIHAASISSAAISLSCLQNYKFGRSTSIAFPQRGIVSEAPYDALKINTQHGLHTLMYLDVTDETNTEHPNQHMTINQAIEQLQILEEKRDENLIKEDTLGVGIARAGSDEPHVHADYLSGLRDYDFGPPQHILVIPGKLHFMEGEALVKLAGAPSTATK